MKVRATLDKVQLENRDEATVKRERVTNREKVYTAG